MYYQDGLGIVSAISRDGINWTKESGIRIDSSNNDGLELKQVGAPTTMQQADETFVMVYAGYIDKKFDPQAPNKQTHLFS